MARAGTIARVHHIPDCDICKQEGKTVPAAYDCKTIWGPWAYVCEEHFKTHTNEVLGTGRGQKLELIS